MYQPRRKLWSGCTTFTVEFRGDGGARRITAGDLRSPIAGKLIYWRLPPGKNSAVARYSAPLTGKRNSIDSATARFITSKDNGGPALILEITFPGIPPPALFFPMVAGYFSGGRRSRDTVRDLSGWSWVDGRDGRPLGSRILTCTSTITIPDRYRTISRNICICVFTLIQVWTRSVEKKYMEGSLYESKIPWMVAPDRGTGVYVPIVKDSSTIFPFDSIPLCSLRIVCVYILQFLVRLTRKIIVCHR